MRVDATVLQYQNQKLVQQLDVQKQELHDLEDKIKELKQGQTSYDDYLITINQLWNQVIYSHSTVPFSYNFPSQLISMSSSNSMELMLLSAVFGWIAFCAWSISFYPQVVLNFRRKSVVGLNFDFVVLNLTKHSSYLVYNASLYFSSAVQRQYHNKYGSKQIIPVAANDFAFSSHAVLLTAFTLFQIMIYDRGTQKVSRITMAIVLVAWTTVAICAFIAIPTHNWLWLVSCFNMLQVCMTVIKYIPQAIMNFKRKSTTGFSIGNILLDLLGGLTNYGQMMVQSIDQHSWVNFYGNMGKTLLSLVSIFFDLLFIVQHYLLYPANKREKSPSPDPVNHESPI